MGLEDFLNLWIRWLMPGHWLHVGTVETAWKRETLKSSTAVTPVIKLLAQCSPVYSVHNIPGVHGTHRLWQYEIVARPSSLGIVHFHLNQLEAEVVGVDCLILRCWWCFRLIRAHIPHAMLPLLPALVVRAHVWLFNVIYCYFTELNLKPMWVLSNTSHHKQF